MALSAKHQETTFHVGDTIDVHYKIIEKEKVAGNTKKSSHEEKKERLQVFEGIVIGIRGKTTGKSFIVRRIGADNVAVERIFPLASPWIGKITVKKQGAVRRGKLYYLRTAEGKEATTIKDVKKQPAKRPTGRKSSPTVSKK